MTPSFRDKRGNDVQIGDTIRIIHHYNFPEWNGQLADIMWDEEKGMYRFVLSDGTASDFHGVHEFEKV